MKTYSSITNRPMINLAEAEFRAATNDLLDGRSDLYVDTLRASHPSVRYFTYCVHRICTPPTAAAWDAYAGGAAETGYIHHAGIRRQLQDGSNWYVMNMGDAGYLAWRRQRSINALLGTEFGDPPHTTGPMDGIVYDLALWYPAFDTGPNENILTSDEYNGTGLLYQDQCVADKIALDTAITSALGPIPKSYANFGDIAFALASDANTIAMRNTSSGITVQTALRYDGGALEVPNATDALSRWSFIDTHCSNKDLFAQGYLDHPPQSQDDKDQAKVGVACFFAMADSPRLYTRFTTDISEPAAHISIWEQNSYARNATALLGDPIGPRIEQGTTATKVRVFKREFKDGWVYLSLQKLGQSGNEIVVVETEEAFKSYSVDGNFSPLSTSFTLNQGDGLVLIRPAAPEPPTPPSGGGGPGGTHQKWSGFKPWPKSPFRHSSKSWHRDIRRSFRKPKGF